jgi:hypothetical protein
MHVQIPAPLWADICEFLSNVESEPLSMRNRCNDSELSPEVRFALIAATEPYALVANTLLQRCKDIR